MIVPMGKLTLLGVAASAAVIAMGADDEQAAAHDAQGNLRPVSMVQLRPMESQVKPQEAAERQDFDRMLRRKLQADAGRKIGNAFNSTSWYVPPPPPPSLPPPAPTAPPLPFTYLGQYKDPTSSATVIFLSSADRVYTVSEGDVIDGTYKVGPMSSGQLELMYLPLNIKQSLSVSGVL